MKDDGGPAFPIIDEYNNVQNHGMSLRDWFAGQGLAGLTSAFDKDGNWTGHAGVGVAEEAYKIADALLAQRAKKGDE